MKSIPVKLPVLLILLIAFFSSCKEEEGCTDVDSLNYNPEASLDDGSCEYGPQVIFKFKFDPDQERLGNFGEPKAIPSGHAAQTPTFNTMGAHYIELSKQGDIPAYNGTTVYESPMTSSGGSEAIDFDQALYAGDGEIFYSTPLKNIPAGTYQYLRISLSYQNYSIQFRAQNIDLTGTIASFVGANTYINSYQIKEKTVTVNANKKQGYWAFETDFTGVQVIEGQAPEGATTVPNPLFNVSAIPPGSCLVTGNFEKPFEVTGTEKEDIIITCSISINNSFEWKDPNGNNIFEPTEGDEVVDMGVRGLVVKVAN